MQFYGTNAKNNPVFKSIFQTNRQKITAGKTAVDQFAFTHVLQKRIRRQEQNHAFKEKDLMKKGTKAAVAGALGGLANGFFGAGGGLFLVPLFTAWLKLEERKAFATSVAVILPLSFVSAVTYFLNGGIDFSSAWPFLLGGAAGGIISGLVFKKVSVNVLRRVFALLILYGGIKALFGF